MGRTDSYVIPVYKAIAKQYTDEGSVVGMFGFTEHDKLSKLWRKMDFYDLRLSNWDINKDWKGGKTYKTIVCLRTSGFALNVLKLLESFHSRLKENGILFIDWSIGSEHYPRDIKEKSWGWVFDNKRCYGEYSNKKCFLYSSSLTDGCIRSEVFSHLCRHASNWKHYRKVNNWSLQIRSEFMDHEIASTNDILNYYDILYEKNWTPLDKNGRFQLYTIQVLRKC